MIRRAALALAGALVLLVLAGATTVVGHSLLVASTPGAGERLTASPPELRLVFSEPLESGYSSADVRGPNGEAIATGIGRPDPNDTRVLVAPLPALPDGVYTIAWRTLSAADGHTDEGAFSFGIGEGPAITGVAGAGAVGGGGGHEAEHGGSAEVQATFLLDLGVLLAFGLMVIAWAVVEPAGRPTNGIVAAAGSALVVLAVGAGVSILLAAAAVSADPVQYATRTRPGLLLLARAVLGGAGGVVVLALARSGRAGGAGNVAIFAGAAALGLTALAGHAAAFGSPAPILVDAVHVGAAGTWMAGLVVLVGFATIGRADRSLLVAIVPRFSAIALACIVLMALTGAYSAWLETRDLTAFDDPYLRLIGLKVVVALAAIGIGAINFLLDPGGGRFGGIARRVGVEAGLAVVVVVVTAALTNGAPTFGGRPIAVADATTTAGGISAPPGSEGAEAAVPPTLSISPGRPGPNRFVVGLPTTSSAGQPAADARLTLDRLDAPATPIDQALSLVGEGAFAADVGGLPADSRWEAVVTLAAPDGTQIARRRFVFGFDATGLSEGRAAPPIDPLTASAVVLAALGLLATVFAVAGGRLPRVEPRTGRLALLVGGPVGAALGLAMLVLGPRI